MLNIMKMNAVGLDGKTPIMNFEFTFDNSTELPKGPGYQLGQRIYVIEEGSIAINNSTNVIYKYSSGKWVKTPNKSTSTINTITENGSYLVASNIATGTGTVNVDVSGDMNIRGIPKIATPIAYDENTRYVLQGLYSGSTSVMISNQYNQTSSHPLYYIILQPISSINFEWRFAGDKSANIIFTASSNTIDIRHYGSAGTSLTDVTYDASSPIQKGDYIQGKTYCVLYWTIGQGSDTSYKTIVKVTEYNEPITFTVE